MKKYIINLLCLFIAIYACNGVNSVVALSQINMHQPCITFLGKDFYGTMKSVGSGSYVSPRGGSGGYLRYNQELDCTKANIEYHDFLRNEIYPIIYILLALLSGIGYFGYKKYKTKKLMSNIESKNTSQVNPE